MISAKSTGLKSPNGISILLQPPPVGTVNALAVSIGPVLIKNAFKAVELAVQKSICKNSMPVTSCALPSAIP